MRQPLRKNQKKKTFDVFQDPSQPMQDFGQLPSSLRQSVLLVIVRRCMEEYPQFKQDLQVLFKSNSEEEEIKNYLKEFFFSKISAKIFETMLEKSIDDVISKQLPKRTLSSNLSSLGGCHCCLSYKAECYCQTCRRMVLCTGCMNFKTCFDCSNPKKKTPTRQSNHRDNKEN